jgi:hypothetical protein
LPKLKVAISATLHSSSSYPGDFLFLGGPHWSGAVGCCRPCLIFHPVPPVQNLPVLSSCQGNMSNNCCPFHHCLCRLPVMEHKFGDFFNISEIEIRRNQSDPDFAILPISTKFVKWHKEKTRFLCLASPFHLTCPS